MSAERTSTANCHRAACPRSGRLRSRAVAPERTMARICREAGAIVRVNVKLRDMNVSVSAQDHREVEVLASGLPLQHGSQLAVDVTLRCALTASRRARPNAATVNGAVADAARRDKETKYSELVNGQRCHLVVVAIETGGRWSSEAYNFVESLARARSRETPHVLRRSAFLACRHAAISQEWMAPHLIWLTSSGRGEVLRVAPFLCKF